MGFQTVTPAGLCDNMSDPPKVDAGSVETARDRPSLYVGSVETRRDRPGFAPTELRELTPGHRRVMVQLWVATLIIGPLWLAIFTALYAALFRGDPNGNADDMVELLITSFGPVIGVI